MAIASLRRIHIPFGDEPGPKYIYNLQSFEKA